MEGVRKNPFGDYDIYPSLERIPISLENPIAQMGYNRAKEISTGWLANLWRSLHYYFDVTHTSILAKIALLVAPWSEKGEWKQEHDSESGVSSQRHNRFAPDLYLPLMSFITYIILVGIVSGAYSQFTPELLGVMASRGIVLMMIELMVLYGGFYVMQINMPHLLDLLAYCGYKYVSCILNLLCSFLLGSEYYYPMFCYSATMYAIFLSSSLKRYTHHYTLAEMTETVSVTKMSFLYFAALLQFPLIFFLGF
eukprot:CAMPEP_0204912672 /NCGR_PEP_ID=MMETSP1397-20131031/10774_1 /ASSEMBLY_ACC=CAM_ASM_000891 /TAXON_ID=49980 /ORGANISM="Climacostomum Climacostomum virens, Strain Stock W-24" /LENGTH=251 /DNA_ID=CAMNT_0052083717 /DNA_START=456 /DNA_END=1214 /DNA_ORIENTATION=+